MQRVNFAKIWALGQSMRSMLCMPGRRCHVSGWNQNSYNGEGEAEEQEPKEREREREKDEESAGASRFMTCSEQSSEGQ